MVPSRLRVGAIVIGGLLATAALPAIASASDEVLVTIPVSGVHRGPEGTQVQVASVAVPADLVGQRCEIFGSTVNQQSVHPGNDLLIVNGDESFVVPDFEDEGNIVHDAGDVETLSGTIQLFVVFGPDGASSGGFRVAVRNCVDDTTDTTLAPTTTEPPSSTTESTMSETTTVETTAVATSVAAEEPPTSPTTEPEPAGPTTPSTTASPTTLPPTTATPSTTAPATTEPEPLGPVAAGDELPITGSSSGLIAAFGSVMLLGGLALAAVGRRRSALD